jgi:flagellar FliL protein
MAENEDMEGAEDAANAAAPKGKSKKKLFIMVGAALVLLGGGAGGYFMFFSHSAPEVKQAEAPKPPAFLEMPDVLVNLSGNPGDRVQYLKLKIVLQVKDQLQLAAIQPAMPRVTDIFQTYLRELRPSDLNGSSGIYRLKEELSRRVNAAISPNEVDAVLFKEIVVQ